MKRYYHLQVLDYFCKVQNLRTNAGFLLSVWVLSTGDNDELLRCWDSSYIGGFRCKC